MKTIHKLPPLPVEPEASILPLDAHSIRMRFICAALSGLCANEESSEVDESYIVDRASKIAELATERYIEDYPGVLREFNRKVGIV